MATANNKARCFVCNKEKNTYSCKGCSNEFCFPHLTEHRQRIETQLEEIINDYDQFQQTIVQQKQNPHNSSLIQQINQWETNSMEKIRQTAEECRQTAMELTQKSISEVEKKFSNLSKKLKKIREENEFNEIDLHNFQLKLTQITKEFLQPSNISIQQDSQEFIKKISVISLFEEIQAKRTKFQQFGITVAGGNGDGQGLNQLYYPYGIFIDNEKSIYIADYSNHRIVKWKLNSKTGQIIAGENGMENQNNQLTATTDVIFDKENNSFIVSDMGNRRVIRCFDQNQTNQQILISKINCWNLTIDKNGFIYVSDYHKNEVRRWTQGDKKGELVAGGNSQGNSLKQLNCPHGVIVDHLSQIYVADCRNDRVMRWCEGHKEGEIVVGGNAKGNQANQLNSPTGLSSDNEKNLYVVDWGNDRIQKYEKILN
ncbi:unnamed protein product [Adineta steineri]|uniref:Uncharacterized protein n=1 Tax=Adineta steineri TaxID=433720 RepID=A0A814FN64_9BILA|nr:unnamed protein product [Adineta steineri]CAF3673384.1 unnamed protein product [Adineta steineri]